MTRFSLLAWDARTKLWLLLCSFCIVFLSRADFAQLLLAVILAVILAGMGRWKSALKFISVFIACTILLYFNTRYGFSLPLVPPFLLIFAYKLIPLAMSAAILTTSTSGELLAAMNKLQVPQGVILPVAVAFRFAPTISTEIGAIIEAMRVRGITGGNGKAILHPLRTFEYVLVPMVIRSLKVADELSASAVARGIECRRKRESYYEMKMRSRDWVTMLAATAGTLLLVFA